MDVEFCDLTYTVSRSRWTSKGKGTEKRILRSVSGRFKAGELTAIIGHSGAGKSSLMDILAGFRSSGVQGSLLTNGQPRDNKFFSKSSCYLAQDDLLQPLMTLSELMEFAAVLKMAAGTPKHRRQEKIAEVLETLGLSECVNTRTEMLSGGQKKRLSVGLELINNPPVFFLDEPTSGLDNVSAKHCIQMLHSLAQEGRTIVCSIHQPSALLFQLFDHVYAMSQGLCIYQGATKELVTFLEAAGLPCPRTHNPSDFVIEVTDGLEPNNIKVLSTSIDNGKTVWKGAPQILDNGSTYDKVQPNGKEHIGTNGNTCLAMPRLKLTDSYNSDIQKISPIFQFGLLLSRMFLQIGRNQTALWIQLIHHIVCAVLIGGMFYNRADDGAEFFIHVKCAISIVVFHAYTHMFVPILTFPVAVKILKREYLNRWYGFGPYYLALNISTLPAKVFFSMIFLSIVYFMWGQPAEWLRFSYFCMTGIMVSVVAEGMGFAIGSTFSITNGTAIGPSALAALLGVAIHGFDFAQNIAWWMNIVMQFSFIRDGLVAIVVTIFGGNRAVLGCSNKKFGYCHFQNPKDILLWGGMSEHTVPMELLKLCGISLVFRALFFVTLRRRLRT